MGPRFEVPFFVYRRSSATEALCCRARLTLGLAVGRGLGEGVEEGGASGEEELSFLRRYGEDVAGGVEAEVAAAVVGCANGEGVYGSLFVFEIEVANLGKGVGAARIVQGRPRQAFEEVGVGFCIRGETGVRSGRGEAIHS